MVKGSKTLHSKKPEAKAASTITSLFALAEAMVPDSGTRKGALQHTVISAHQMLKDFMKFSQMY